MAAGGATMSPFQSLLAVQIQNFINLRRLSGTDYQSQAQLLGYFDRFLVNTDFRIANDFNG